MFLDSTDLDQVALNSKCLPFLVLCGEHGEEWDIEDRSDQVGQTYSPDTGIVGWPNRIGPDAIPPISLRSNSQLAKWEPLAPKKFNIMALDQGVIGEDIQVPGRVVEPYLAAVAVTPPGFVFRWEHPRGLWISDVRRLAELKHPLANTSNSSWSKYKSTVGARDIDPHAGSAHIGDGTMPAPVNAENLSPSSLAQCSSIAGALIHNIGYDPSLANYTPEVKAFIQQQFGVNVDHIGDWHEAIRHRTLNRLLGGTAPDLTTRQRIPHCGMLWTAAEESGHLPELPLGSWP
jgi:hypothetical protein